jgi:Secretion system C-terminal sorting domain
MKALHGLFLTLFIIYTVKAQDCTTHTFVNSENILKYATFSTGFDVGSIKLTFSKDSFLLNQKFYKKLIVLDYEIFELTKDYFFREDNGKVYLFQDGIETLMYDFCLNIGDRFNSEWQVISKVPLSTDGGATTRNQFILQSNSSEIQKWIEGIGGFRMELSPLNFALCEYYTKDQRQVYYEPVNSCTSPVKTSHVSHENIWHLTVPQWVNPGYDYWLSFSKDSFLFDQRYYRKQISKKSNSDEWEETNFYFREYLGRVFTKYKDEKEILSYNYSAEVGDTLYSDQWPNNHFIVSEIENIITLDGITRRKMTVESDCGGDGTIITWIEGIGETQSLDGLEIGCIVYDPVPQFNCLLTNNQTAYSNGFCLSSTEPTDLQTNILILPNPAADQITIQGDVQTMQSIQISDISGRIMLEKVIQNEPSINVASLASGVYICKLQGMNGKSQSMKFVKL